MDLDFLLTLLHLYYTTAAQAHYSTYMRIIPKLPTTEPTIRVLEFGQLLVSLIYNIDGLLGYIR